MFCVNKKCLQITLSLFITGACLTFVSFQSKKCISKYINNPQGTKLSLQNAGKIHQFPAITICDHITLDDGQLKRCGISTPNDYIYGNWVGNNATLDENCTNPKGLYESIISKPENLYWSISYRYFDGTTSTEYASNTSSEIRSHIDTIFYGRCFTFNPTTEMIRLGIQMVELQLITQSTIYVHTKRLFQTVKDITEIIVPKNSMIKMDIDYEVYNMLDFGGQPCNAEPEFDKDFCTQDAFEKKALEKYGCTGPFGPNKDKICRDQKTGSKVMEFYGQIFRNLSNNCLSPCSFVSTKGIKIMEQGNNYGYVMMMFKENIKVIEAHHLYSTLSLIAEIGGYVGLFLGVSVNQVSTLMNDLIDKIDGGFNRL